MDEFKKQKFEEKNKLFGEFKDLNKQKSNVRYVVKRHTQWIDRLIVEFSSRFFNVDKLSVVAVGGYGRKQLNPASDIDILIVREKYTEELENSIRDLYDLFYFLGYECSVSVRNVKECVDYARNDDTIRTALLDDRLVFGDDRLFKYLNYALQMEVFSKKRDEFIQLKMEYMKSRYEKYGNTVFVLEPNLKEGVGGLRDYHTLIWVSKVLFGSKNALDMKKKGLIESDDYNKLRDALYFLWQLRNALHFEAKRKNDVLYLDLRERIARDISIASNNRFSASERLMRKFYYNARNVERIANRYLDIFLGKKETKRVFFIDSFTKMNDAIEIEGDVDFRQLLFIFYYSALYNKSIYSKDLTKVKPMLSLLHKFRSDKTLAFVFRSILMINAPVVRTLRIMHEMNFLDKFIPEFGSICCLTEDSFYHKYTVDEHSIQALGYLDRLYYYDEPKTFLMRLSHIWKSLQPHDRMVLRLATLLHDIGKVEKKNHEIVGSKMAERVASRLNLGKDLAQKVSFLVENHLLINKIISTLDIEDPKTLEKFLEVVDSKEKLNLLVLLTYADMKAVNDNVWTSWKETLIEQLYLKATYSFEDRNYDEYLRINALDSKRKIKKVLGNKYDDIVDLFPDNIFNDIDFKSMATYIKDIKDTSRNAFVYKSGSNTAKLVVYYDNIFGFFNKISGILACLDVNIVTAKSYNLLSNKIVDIFTVRLDDNIELDDYKIEDMLADVFNGAVDIEECMESKKRKFLSRLQKAKIELSLKDVDITVDNDSSDIYTVIRIYAPDRIGLVYYITKVFTEFQLQVGMFILDTKGAMAVDTFYVVDDKFRKIYSQKLIGLIKSKLYEVLI